MTTFGTTILGAAFWVALSACDGGSDDPTPHSAGPTDTEPTTGDGFCAVRRLFVGECLQCHDAASEQGDLDLETDPHAALVGVVSATYDVPLVTAGDPAASLLVRKLAGELSAVEGGVMPPTGVIPGAAALVSDWIAAGATESCAGTTPTTPTTPERAHSVVWAEPGIHGMAFKYQQEGDCRSCHGADLRGGDSGVGCDDCHRPDWRTDCTYCHGGTASATGAPPEDLDDNTDPATTTFPPHAVHESGRIAPAFPCAQCHPASADLLAAGHVLDDPTPGEAEVVMGNGTWAARSCSDTYCHGNGRNFAGGDVAVDAGPRGCGSCHAGVGGNEVPLDSMSGAHLLHLAAGATCADCHPDARGNDEIVDPARHVEGTIDLGFPAGLRRDAGTGRCAGACHDHVHAASPW